jgi:hypothetical protein
VKDAVRKYGRQGNKEDPDKSKKVFQNVLRGKGIELNETVT